MQSNDELCLGLLWSLRQWATFLERFLPKTNDEHEGLMERTLQMTNKKCEWYTTWMMDGIGDGQSCAKSQTLDVGTRDRQTVQHCER